MKYSIARSMSRCPDWRKNKVSLNELRRNTQLFDLCPDVPTEGKIKSVSMNWEEILNYARSMSRCPDWRKNKVSINELREKYFELFGLCPGVPVEENKARKDFSWWNIQLLDLCPDVPTEGKIKSVSMNWEEILNYSIYVPVSRLKKIKLEKIFLDEIFNWSIYVPMSRLKEK